MARRIAGEEPVTTNEPVGTAGYTDTGYADTGYAATDHGTAGVSDGRERPWGDRVRWGPLWAGLVTTLATFTLLQLLFVATKAVDIDLGSGDTSFSFWTAVSALVAFFVAGAVAGSKLWPRRHGVDLRDHRRGWGTARA